MRPKKLSAAIAAHFPAEQSLVMCVMVALGSTRLTRILSCLRVCAHDIVSQCSAALRAPISPTGEETLTSPRASSAARTPA